MIIVVSVINYLITIYEFLILLRVLLSWFNVNPYNRLVRILYRITDPVLRPFQRLIPPIGGTLDISPVVALIVIEIIRRIILALLGY